MLFRARRRSDQGSDSLEALLEEIEALSGQSRQHGDLESARRLLSLRHRAGLALLEGAAPVPPADPSPAFERLAEGAPPEAVPADLSPELVRAAILRSGCLLVRGLIPRDEAARLVQGIDRAYEAREAGAADAGGDGHFEEFEPDPRFDLRFERAVLRSGGGAGLWMADAPRLMADVLDAFDRCGLRALAAGYLGEQPALSVNKSLLRRVRPTLFEASTSGDGRKPSAWHQDGAFMGPVRALNVWLSLSRCGDEAPGLDIVPRRLDGIVPTGTEGAAFDWSVSSAMAEEAAGPAGIVRPVFEPGDVLLFDELFLHSTAADPGMPGTRYAVESWFFGPSAFPSDYAPLAA